MVVCLVEQVASIAMSEQDPRKEAGPLPPLLHVIELLSSSLRVLPRFVGFPLRLSEFVLDVVEAAITESEGTAVGLLALTAP